MAVFSTHRNDGFPGVIFILMKKSAIFILFTLFSLSSHAQYYDLYFDRAMETIDIEQYRGVGFAATQKEAMETAFSDLSVKLGAEVWSSTTVSYSNGEKKVNTETRVDASLSIPRDMLDTEVYDQGKHGYYVEVVLKVKDYILDCERRLSDSERYTAEYISKNHPGIEESTALRIGMLQYRRKVLNSPIYLNFDGKETMKRIAYCDRNIEYLRQYLGDTEPMLVLDESLEFIQ